MIDALRRILDAVNSKTNFEEALQVLVTLTKQALDADAASVFLLNEKDNAYVLRATDGLCQKSVGKSQLKKNEGLVGLVSEREEPLNIPDAFAHPRFHFLQETGETVFASFLSAPLVHRKKVIGVIVSQRRTTGKFSAADERFLTTLSAQIASVIVSSEARSAVIAKQKARHGNSKSRFQGTCVAGGIALGPAFVLGYRPGFMRIDNRRSRDSRAELSAFHRACSRVRLDLDRLKEQLSQQLAAEELALFDVYQNMLDDEAFVGKICRVIEGGVAATSALKQVVESSVSRFSTMDNEYFRARATDIHDLGLRLLGQLLGVVDEIPKLSQPVVLVGQDVSATMLMEWPREYLVGVVSLQGTSNSHMSIIARALELPAVVGIPDLPMHSLHGDELILDAFRGDIIVNPSKKLAQTYRRFLKEEQRVLEGIDAEFDQPAKTMCGHDIQIYANIGLMTDSKLAIRRGAQGVGLLRTEVSFMGYDAFPSEDEQVEIYREHLDCFSPYPVSMRTLDIGGDKALPYFPIQETNPFLGWRGIRVTLDHPEIFMVQIRAMLRASEGYENLQILLPMVSSVDEVDEALRLIHRAFKEVREEGADILMPKIGVMLEVPAAVILAKTFADRVDFLSVGTNDLIQYLLAVDRNNSKVSDLYDPFHPVVIHMLAHLAQEMSSFNVGLSVCGEIAGDPALAAVLVGMGYRCLSMNASSLLRVKWVLRRVTLLDLEALVDSVRKCQTSAGCREVVKTRLSALGIGEVVNQPRVLRA